MRSYISRYGTYFSISLFLQVRGAEEEEHGVLGSVLLLSPLLVEGISANTDETDKYLNLIKNLTLSQQNVRSRNYLPSLAHLENSGVILLEGIPPLQERQTLVRT